MGYAVIEPICNGDNLKNAVFSSLLGGLVGKKLCTDHKSTENNYPYMVIPLAFMLIQKDIEERYKTIQGILGTTNADKHLLTVCHIYVEYAITLIQNFENDFYGVFQETQEQLLKFYKDSDCRNEITYFTDIIVDCLMTTSSTKSTLGKAITDNLDCIPLIGGLAGIFYKDYENFMSETLSINSTIYTLVSDFSNRVIDDNIEYLHCYNMFSNGFEVVALNTEKTEFSYPVYLDSAGNARNSQVKPKLMIKTDTSSIDNLDKFIFISISKYPNIVSFNSNTDNQSLLGQSEQRKVFDFIIENYDLLMKHWNGELDDYALMTALRTT